MINIDPPSINFDQLLLTLINPKCLQCQHWLAFGIDPACPAVAAPLFFLDKAKLVYYKKGPLKRPGEWLQIPLPFHRSLTHFQLAGEISFVVPIFYIKYIVIYGAFGNIAKFDQLIPPKTPTCVGATYKYAEDWRYVFSLTLFSTASDLYLGTNAALQAHWCHPRKQ